MSKKIKSRKSNSDFINITYSEFFKTAILKLLKLENSPCPWFKCNKPCPDNIYCLCGLFNRDDFTDYDAVNDDNSESFDKDLPRGLHNFGNTCYLNSFLQIYFHSTKFRKIIYESFISDENVITKDLQKLFAQMQLSYERVLHPSDIISDLDLSEFVQQDAPEFHSLFMTVLDSCSSGIHDGLGNLFTGQQNYVTRCKDCNYTSTVDSEFRELSLKPLSSLDASIQDFLKPELLTGDNLYSCPKCKELKCGERSTVIKKLPAILCIQFLRYSFHDSAGKQKSSTAVHFPEIINMRQYVKSEKGADKKQPIEYVLKAILLHIGDEPNSGHYQCILHNKYDEWILCDDSTITKLVDTQSLTKVLHKNSNYKNSVHANSQSTSQNNSHSSTSNGQSPNTVLTSTNAYMLFYETKSSFEAYEDELSNLEIPVSLKSTIDNSNTNIVSVRESIKSQTVIKKSMWESRSEIVVYCLRNLTHTNSVVFDESKYSEIKTDQSDKADTQSDKSNDDDPFLVSLKSLRSAVHYFELENESWRPYSKFVDKNADDYQEQCKHDVNKLGCKASVVNCANLRLVRRQGLNELVDNRIIENKKSINVWNLHEDLCQVCWRMHFEKKRLEGLCKMSEYMKLLDKYKKIGESIREVLESEDEETKSSEQYWVSRSALKKWKALCLQRINYRYDENPESSSTTNPEDNQVFPVNGDLICTPHRCLVRGRPGIKISSADWQMLLDLLVGRDQSHTENVVLSLCVAESEFCQRCSAEYSPSDRANNERESLSFLLNSSKLTSLKKRFMYCADQKLLTVFGNAASDDNTNNSLILSLIPITFLNDWKKFIKQPSKEYIISELDYYDILCDHEDKKTNHEVLIYMPWNVLFEQGYIQLLYPDEMNRIKQHYPDLVFYNICIRFERVGSIDQVPQSSARSGISCLKYQFKAINLYSSLSKSYDADVTDQDNDDDLVCHRCYQKEIMDEKYYNDATIFVRLIPEIPSGYKTGVNNEPADSTETAQLTSSVEHNRDSVVVSKKGDNEEQDVDRMPPTKKKKLSKKSVNKLPMVPLKQPVTSSCIVRRSERSKKHPSDVSVRISSDATVKDLKVKLMNLLEVAPLDQYLYFNETSLDQNQAQMVDVGIRPGSVLELFLSDRNNMGDNVSISSKNSGGNNPPSGRTRSTKSHNNEYDSSQTPETGFRGTKLVDK